MLLAVALSACTTANNTSPTASGQLVVSPTPTPLCEPYESSIVCKDRLASQRITPVPPNTPSAVFLTAEAEYQQWLAQVTPTPWPPAPTPTPSYVLLPGLQAGALVLRSRSLYQEHPLFELVYAEEAWRLEDTDDGPVLVHNTIENCRLLWMSSPIDTPETPIIKQKKLAGYQIEVYEFHQTGVVSYGFSIDKNYYSFILYATGNSWNECQTAVETVLNTFRLVPD